VVITELKQMNDTDCVGCVVEAHEYSHVVPNVITTPETRMVMWTKWKECVKQINNGELNE